MAVDLSFLGDQRVVSFDIETTGLSRVNDFIIEFGVVEIVSGKIRRSAGALFGGGKSGQKALEAHGITDASRAGLPHFSSKAKAAQAILKGAILLGHNIKGFDIPFIRAAIRREGNFDIVRDDGTLHVIDTLLLARRHMRCPSNKLGDLCEMYGIEYGQHRAEGDALCTWKFFLKLVEHVGSSDPNQYIKIVRP